MKRIATVVGTLAVSAGISWFFPLFHVVPLERAAREKAATTFNPTEFAEKFWNDQLLKSLGKAVRADVLLAAIQSSPAEARGKFSRSLGVSESYTYFVSGDGRVLAVSEEEISLAVSEAATTPEISLRVGLIFGNAVRDGTGLLDVSDFPNSQDFNGIAEELNRIIEAKVIPGVKKAAIGQRIQFVGCAEVVDEEKDLKPLRVIPVHAKVQ